MPLSESSKPLLVMALARSLPEQTPRLTVFGQRHRIEIFWARANPRSHGGGRVIKPLRVEETKEEGGKGEDGLRFLLRRFLDFQFEILRLVASFTT